MDHKLATQSTICSWLEHFVHFSFIGFCVLLTSSTKGYCVVGSIQNPPMKDIIVAGEISISCIQKSKQLCSGQIPLNCKKTLIFVNIFFLPQIESEWPQRALCTNINFSTGKSHMQLKRIRKSMWNLCFYLSQSVGHK